MAMAGGAVGYRRSSFQGAAGQRRRGCGKAQTVGARFANGQITLDRRPRRVPRLRTLR
jgi:hypothetical protein